MNSKGCFSCSFCGKIEDEIEILVAGPAVYICNECIDICNFIIRHKKKQKQFKELFDLRYEEIWGDSLYPDWGTDVYTNFR